MRTGCSKHTRTNRHFTRLQADWTPSKSINNRLLGNSRRYAVL